MDATENVNAFDARVSGTHSMKRIKLLLKKNKDSMPCFTYTYLFDVLLFANNCKIYLQI